MLHLREPRLELIQVGTVVEAAIPEPAHRAGRTMAIQGGRYRKRCVWGPDQPEPRGENGFRADRQASLKVVVLRGNRFWGTSLPQPHLFLCKMHCRGRGRGVDEEEVGSPKVVVLRGSQLPGFALNSLRHQSATDWGGHLFLFPPGATQVVPAALCEDVKM